jgi:hypothetical protein
LLLLLTASLSACSSDTSGAGAAGGRGSSGRGGSNPSAGETIAGKGGAGAAGHSRSDAGAAAGGRSSGGAGASDSDAGSVEGGSGGAAGGSAITSVDRTESPWGVAPSHSSSVGIASWAAAVATSGVDWIRGFDAGNSSAVLKVAADNGYQVSGIFNFSDPGGEQTFPVSSIPAFKAYVTDSVRTSAGVKHWEVWNEPPNFSANKSPSDYAKIVVAAYDAAKAADPNVQVGLAAQSVNLNFLADALSAGAANHFDYVTVHPYETLGLVDAGWEAQFMSIVPTIRKLLADKSPARKDVPIWFTELGEPVGDVTAEHQADTLVKAYVMGLAQGAHRIHWFEPLDGDSGAFGLIAGGSGAGAKRPAFTALSLLIDNLGQLPRYVGWTLLNDKHYAFVFVGPTAPVMIAWTGRDGTDSVNPGVSVRTVDLHTGATTDKTTIDLTHSPVLVIGVPRDIVDQAQANRSRPFPWDGDYSTATSVSFSAAEGAKGLHALHSSPLTTIDGGPAYNAALSASQAFTVDPSFNAYTAITLQITVVLRRNTTASAGFNLRYESTTGYKSTGSWYTVPGSDKWYTQTWTVSDPQLVGKWGYHLSFDSDSTQNSNYSLQSVTLTKQ